MKAIIAAALFVSPMPFACLNVAGTKLDGNRVETGHIPASELRHAMREDPKRRSSKKHFGEGVTSRARTQLQAVDMIYRAEYQAALKLLLALEGEGTIEYDTAGNLGTAYELMGDNTNALKWINEEIKRNPDAHHSSEWLHAVILRAKIDAAKHPGTRLVKRIIDVPADVNWDTEIHIQGETYSAGIVRDALRHQLRERMLLVKPKDPYVADLLYSFAILEANFGIVEQALELLELAKEYGFADEALLVQHQRHYQAVVLKGWIRWWATWGLPILIGAFLLLRWMWKHRQEKWFFWSARQRDAYRQAQALAKLSDSNA